MNLSHWFQDTITWSQPTSYSNGDLVQGPTASAEGRLEEYYRMIKVQGGEERQAQFKFATSEDIPLNARVYVPDATPGAVKQSLTVLQRQTAKTLSGYRYYILTLGA